MSQDASPTRPPRCPRWRTCPNHRMGEEGIGGGFKSQGRRQAEGKLDRVRVCSKSQKCSKSRKHSKSRRRSKSRKRSKSCGRDEAEMCSRYEMQKPGIWSSQCRREEPSRSPSNTMKQGGRSAEQSAPCSEMSNFLKLKEEVVKHAQSYIWRPCPNHRPHPWPGS